MGARMPQDKGLFWRWTFPGPLWHESNLFVSWHQQYSLSVSVLWLYLNCSLSPLNSSRLMLGPYIQHAERMPAAALSVVGLQW